MERYGAGLDVLAEAGGAGPQVEPAVAADLLNNRAARARAHPSQGRVQFGHW